MMETSPNYANELSQLEYVCQELGAQAVITATFHAEYANKGIEYSWGYSKYFYIKYLLTSRKGKANFDKLVAKCISREIITKDMVRNFSGRVWGYIATYKILEERKGNQTYITQYKIENMKKDIKSHQSALDFDKVFIMKEVSVTYFDYVE